MRDYHAVARLIVRYIGTRTVSDMEVMAVSDWMASMVRDGYAPKTCSKAFRLLSQALKFAVGQGAIDKNPCDFCKPPKQMRSRFVEWAFVNAVSDLAAARFIGTGTSEQIGNSYPVKWNEVKPGDLLFLAGTNAGALNHVGIVLSVNGDGTPREVVHCSGSADNVVVTGPDVFSIARRPYVYGE